MRPKREIPTSQEQRDEWRERKAKSRRRLKSCPKDTQTAQFDFTNGQQAPASSFPLQKYLAIAKDYQHKRGGRILLEALHEIERLREIAALLQKEFHS